MGAFATRKKYNNAILLTGVSVNNPASIFGANLLGWYKADTGITKLGGGAISNGDIVGQLNDNTTNTYNLTPHAVTPSGGPTYLSAGINGLPAFNFTNAGPGNGGDSHLVTAENVVSLGGQAFSVFIVCQMDSGASNNARLFCFLGSGDTNDVAANTSVGWLRDASTNAHTTYRGASVTQMATQGFSGPNTTMHLGMVYDGAGSIGTAGVTPYVNGVAGTQYTGAESTDTFAATGSFGIAAQYPSGYSGAPFLDNGWRGPVAEIVCVKAAATALQIASLETYFASRGF